MKGIAIDPGTQMLGYALFEWVDNRLTILDCGRFKAKTRPLEFRLHQIFHWLGDVLTDDLRVVVSEQSFSNHKSPGGGDTVRECLGVLKVQAVERNLPVVLLRPSDGKWATVGKIGASKLEVAEAVLSRIPSLRDSLEIFTAEEIIKRNMDHVTDAISIAIAYVFTHISNLVLYDAKGDISCYLEKPLPKTKTKKRGAMKTSTTPSVGTMAKSTKTTTKRKVQKQVS